MKIRIIIKGNYYDLIKRLLNNNIFYENLIINQEEIILSIYYENYKILKRYYKENIKIIKYYGIQGIVNYLKKEYIFLLALAWGIVLLIILSNIVFSIEINTNDSNLKKIVYESLEEHDIKINRFKKSYKELEKIKKSIKKNNKEIIEWIEISELGTKYIVEITPRIIKTEQKKDDTIQSVVASKDGLILYITAESGEIVKEVGDYVKKGDEIISGNIYKNEKTLSEQVHASGKVFAEVWYIINTTIPYEYVEYVKTGKVIHHYYLKFFGGPKMTILGKYDTNLSINEKELVIDKAYLPFKVYKETKELYEYKTFKVSNKEALEEGIRRSTISLENKLDTGEYIIDKKVLNIKEFSSKINIELFYKVYEDITGVMKLNRIEE